MKKFKQILSLILAMSLLIAMLSGCGGNKKKTVELDLSKHKYGTEYPIETTDEVLTIWTMNKPDAKYMKIEDQPYYKEWSKRTGIKVEYIYPTGDAAEQFNLMIASGKYPDAIDYRWLDGTYNPAQAIKENVILPINDIIKAYAPDYYKHLMSDPVRAKYLCDEDGNYFGFAGLQNQKGAPWLGPIVRKDLMEKLNLETPETIDDWTNMLKAFKDAGIASPLTFRGALMADSRFAGFIFGGFNTAYGFYHDDGDVKYGPLEPQFKEAVELLRSWYKEGLLDKEFVSIDDATIDAKMLDGRSAITPWFLSRLETWDRVSEEAGNNNRYIALPFPTAEAGTEPEYGYMPEAYGVTPAMQYMAITTQCKNVELLAKYLNYPYTEEGIMLANFGPEGVTYTMEDDEIKLTEEFDKNFDLIMPYRYTSSEQSISDGSFGALRYKKQSQKDAQKIWVTNMSAHQLPPVQATADEISQLSKIETELSTYSNEKILSFIVGNESMDKWDDFVAELKKIGVDEAIKIKTAQMERFNNR